MVSPVPTLMENVWLAVFDAESITLTVKLALPAVGVGPVKTPPLDKLSPIAVRLVPPDVIVQVSPVPVPPVLAKVCE